MNETRNQQTKQYEGQARAVQSRVEEDRRSGTGNLLVRVHTILSWDGRTRGLPSTMFRKWTVARVLRKYCKMASTQRGTRRTFKGRPWPAFRAGSSAKIVAR